MIFFKIFLFFSLFSLNAFSEPQIELEHTYFENGSSWGTDDFLRNQIDLPESAVPEIFKTPLQRPLPRVVQVPKLFSRKSLFSDNKIYLYKTANICVNEKIPINSKSFERASLFFLNQIAGARHKERMVLNFISTSISLSSKKLDSLKECDVFMTPGLATEFPFKFFSQDKSKDFNIEIPQLVLGLYYRYKENTLPVVVFHPDVVMNFDSKDLRYLYTQESEKLNVDGKTLFFHELAHVFGFSHVTEPYIKNRASALTVMGLSSHQRNEMDLHLRFSGASELWKYWDLEQNSVFRVLLARFSKSQINFNSESKFKLSKKSNQVWYCRNPGEEVHLRFEQIGFDDLNRKSQEPLLSESVFNFSLPTITQKKKEFEQWTFKVNDLLQVQFWNHLNQSESLDTSLDPSKMPKLSLNSLRYFFLENEKNNK
ncbi:MAG TPA: hypothetical protein PLJ21_09865, partial [Pseudobdellovibrionaceae bacterium]|nr:hypothetical protein [Pseudobdellovibrionaceae bacterium]